MMSLNNKILDIDSLVFKLFLFLNITQHDIPPSGNHTSHLGSLYTVHISMITPNSLKNSGTKYLDSQSRRAKVTSPSLFSGYPFRSRNVFAIPVISLQLS